MGRLAQRQLDGSTPDAQMSYEFAIITASTTTTGAGPPEADAVVETARINVIINVSVGRCNAVGGARQAISREWNEFTLSRITLIATKLTVTASAMLKMCLIMKMLSIRNRSMNWVRSIQSSRDRYRDVRMPGSDRRPAPLLSHGRSFACVAAMVEFLVSIAGLPVCISVAVVPSR